MIDQVKKKLLVLERVTEIHLISKYVIWPLNYEENLPLINNSEEQFFSVLLITVHIIDTYGVIIWLFYEIHI